MPGLKPSRFELVTVPAGARSLRSIEHGETFHPGIGPMAEARVLHVAQHDLAARTAGRGDAFVIWDIGLGAAANALAVLEAARDEFPEARVELHSFDATLEPLHFGIEHAEELVYPLPWKAVLREIFERGSVSTGRLTWRLHLGDFRLAETAAEAPAPEAVIFDPYSPAANPGMWTTEVFAAIRERVERVCTLSTYTRSTVMRARLLRAGWFVGHGAATGEKTETTVAGSELGVLHRPLGRNWLERLRRSTAQGLGERGGAGAAEELAGHPQFFGEGVGI